MRYTPAKSTTRKAKPVFKMVNKDIANRHYQKQQRQIEQNESSHISFVHATDHVLVNGRQCSFSEMVFKVGRLVKEIEFMQ